MHTPTDKDFYIKRPHIGSVLPTPGASFKESYGQDKIKKLVKKHKLKSLDSLLLPLRLLAMTGLTPNAETRATLAQDHHQISWYNEIALMPVRILGREIESVVIDGIFVRAEEDKVEDVLSEPAAQILLQIAEAFDLPVVHIFDGNYYETDVGGSTR